MTNCACEAAYGGDDCASRGIQALSRMPDSMLLRLMKVIEKNYEYFTLTGSDPRQEGGCCPSEDVRAANALVEAGVLEAWEKPTPGGGCTFTVYAFRGEIGTTGPKPTYSLDHAFREKVQAALSAIASNG